jgi:hypothetical protein
MIIKFLNECGKKTIVIELGKQRKDIHGFGEMKCSQITNLTIFKVELVIYIMLKALC